jgi:hypothetical protein
MWPVVGLPNSYDLQVCLSPCELHSFFCANEVDIRCIPALCWI